MIDNFSFRIIGAIAAFAVFSLEFCGAQSVNFSHLLLEDGIPSGGVSAIGQDQRGFIWFATQDGLRKYDGFEMRSIRREAVAGDFARLGENVVNVLSVKKDQIWYGTDSALHFLMGDATEGHKVDSAPGGTLALARDQEGSLWIGGRDGLFKLVPGEASPVQIAAHLSVAALYWDSDHRHLYIGTLPGEVLRLGDDGELQPVFSCGVRLNALLRDPDGNLWIATRGAGLIMVKGGKEQLRLRFKKSGAQTTLPSNDVTCLFADSDKQLWIGTRVGLARYDSRSGELTTYHHDPDDPRTLPTNEIRCLFEDQRKVLWVGHTRGASRFPIGQRVFDHVKHRTGDPSSLSHDAVFGILEDSAKRLWVGTEEGLNLRDAQGGFRHFDFPSADGDSADAQFIYVIREAPDGRLWLGTRGSGLVIFDPERETYQTRRHDPNSADGIPHNSITALATDSSGQVWVGTSGGLAVLDTAGALIRRYNHDPGNAFSLASDAISDLHIDGSDALYVATEDAGVQRLDASSGRFLAIGESFSAKITSLYEDAERQIWIGTRNSGALVYDPQSRQIARHFHQGNSDLPNNDVFGILQDRAGCYWFSTGAGIARLDLGTNALRTFDTEDGIQSMVFHPKAYASDSRGRLYFGGPRGFNIIDPESLPNLRLAHQTVLTGLEVNGARIDPTKSNPYLRRPLALTKELQMRFDQSRRLTFTFATLDYTYPTGNRFRYRMRPVEEEWTHSGNEPRGTYSSLPAGQYTLEVQSSLDGESWNENSASLDIHVLPLWHQSWQARTGFALVGLALIASAALLFHKKQARKIQRKAEILELDRNKAEAALASQLQRAMLVQRAADGLHEGDAHSAFALTIDRLIAHFGADCCALCEYWEGPPEVLNLLIESNPGMGAEFSMGKISPGNSFVRNVLSQRHAVASGNVAADENFAGEAAALLSFGIRAVAAVKTSFQGATNGILFLIHHDEFPWAEDDVRLFETVADQIGVNIANHRLSLADEKQRAELDEARRVAEVANQAKSDFLAKMTHELRTPLNAILGFSEILTQDISITAEQRSTLDIINGSGEHLLQTINDILDMSKIESGAVEINKEEFDLRETLNGVAGMLRERAESKNLTLTLECAEDVPDWILADKVKLRQILVNLVGNAIKFTEAGSITIRTTLREPAEIPASGQDAGCRIQFDVIDTGSGISEQQIGKLFEKFSQTDSGRKSGQGTGLGLAISKNFVELMGGEITIRSTLGAGTVFGFDICCNELAVEVVEKKKTSSPATYAKLASGHEEIRVLIAEDQLPNRILLRTILTQRGFKVFEAENGLEAVKAWKSYDPHIIFMDNDMPVMDGMTATREITSQATGARPCIVSCTAYALDSYREAAMEAGCSDFLSKPYQQRQLFELISRHLSVEFEKSDPALAAASPVS